MKKICSFIVRFRYWLLGLFAILVGSSCILMQHVNINYNLMQYLDKGSSSTVALTVMEDEFGSVGQCQVLVTHLTYQEAEEAKDKIESVEGVASVVFASSEADSDYYNPVTGDALYKVFLTTSNYDKATYKTLDRIRAELKDYTISLNGGSVESEFLTKALARDMTIILTIVVVVVLGILLLTSSSYVEPLIFLFVAGGAILINLGTNILLNAIPYIGNSMSFITKSIAAVMQLALSMDYAIILLHTYKEEKEHYDDNKEAMKVALRRAFAPVSSSSITTIAGLVALMFMSFSIGFDVGLVLAKGILLSLLCVFLFMPALLLTFDKLLAKTSHKPIDRIIIGKIKAHHLKRKQQGKKVHSMASFQKKTRIVVPLLAVALFGVAAVFNFTSTYSFTLQASTDANSTINVDDKKITDEFGTQNTLVVLIEKKDRQKSEIKVEEEEIINYLKNYEYNGEKVINSVQGYSTYGVYNDLTAEQFAGLYLDADMYNANVRGVTVLYQYLQDSGLAYLDSENNLRANVYNVVAFAKENEGAKKITEQSQALMDKVASTYYVELTKEQFAAANNINATIVENIYSTMSVEKATTYDVLKFVHDNNYAVAAFTNIQNNINSSYEDLKTNGVFNADGSVNETVVGGMKAYCDAYEAGQVDTTDPANQQKYATYKEIVIEFNKEQLMAQYPFITEDTASFLLQGKETVPNYLVVQASSLNNIPAQYGQGMQGVINAKYAEIPVKDEVITKEDAKMNYGVDDQTLAELYQSGDITNGVLFKFLSDNKYYTNEQYQGQMQARFDASYEAFANFESDNYIRVIFNFNMPTSSKDSFKAINEISDHLYGTYDDVKLVSETFVYSQIKQVFNRDVVIVNIISFVAILLIIAVTFKSAFTPVLLTLLIQGAIWFTMGISTVFGKEIFFICYIVVMCVQMGATIDYGILLTNNYIQNRKKYSRKDSMALAMNSSIATILTSGSILVLATLIIGLVSKVSIVSDLGMLLSRGCLISLLMIIFVLPQCLIICDKVIEKTSVKTKFADPNNDVLDEDLIRIDDNGETKQIESPEESK